MTRPSIQIDDEVREMTEEEYENYLVLQAAGQLPLTEPEE